VTSVTMTIRQVGSLCTKALRRRCRVALQHAIRLAVTVPVTRKLLNFAYLRLSWSHKLILHSHFCTLFRGYRGRLSPAVWAVEFAGKRIKIPLRPRRIWLDWDTAISICGHDIDLKQTYAFLCGSPFPPELFIDVGANYGTHSLLFLTRGIDTVTFEPNVACHDDFRAYCEVNGVRPRIEGIALGDCESTVDLWYPEGDTWLGSTDMNVQSELRSRSDVKCQRVTQKTLDHFRSEYGNRRLLIKIDTEGNEAAILRGGYCTLKHDRPVVIFESWPDERQRGELFRILSGFGYVLCALPWTQTTTPQVVTKQHFLRSVSTNFLAVPASGLSNGSIWERA
jgi:FkbM family methyltransferase